MRFPESRLSFGVIITIFVTCIWRPLSVNRVQDYSKVLGLFFRKLQESGHENFYTCKIMMDGSFLFHQANIQWPPLDTKGLLGETRISNSALGKNG